MKSSLYHPLEEAFLFDYFLVSRPKYLLDIESYGSRLCTAFEEGVPEIGSKPSLVDGRIGIQQHALGSQS